MLAALARELAAEGNSSLSESKIENADDESDGRALRSAQNEELRRQLSLASESVKTLTESLAESNAEAEDVSPEVFGSAIANGSARARCGEQGSSEAGAAFAERGERSSTCCRRSASEYRDQMLGLNEAMLRLLKTSQGGDAQARMEVEAQLRSTNELATKSTGFAGGAEPTFDGRQRDQREGRVVAGGRQHRRKAGSEDRDAAASDAGGRR